MAFLLALTIGLGCGLTAGLLVYCVISYFEKDPKSSQIPVKDELSKMKIAGVPSNCVTVTFNGKAKIIAIPSLNNYEVVSNQVQLLERKGREEA